MRRRKIEKMDEKGLLELKLISNVVQFPEGNRALFVVTTLDEKDNTYISHIYSIGRRKKRQLTFSGKRNISPRISPDGNRFAFLSDRHGKKEKGLQLYMMETEGGDAIPLTDEERGISQFRWIDENRIVYVTSHKKRQRTPYPKDTDVRIIDRLFYKLDSSGFLTGFSYIVKVMDVEKKESEKLFETDFSVSGLTYHKGKYYFVSNMESDWDLYLYSYIYEYDPAKGTFRKLMSGNWSISSFKPFQDKIIFVGNRRQHGFADISHFYELDLDTGNIRDLTPGLDRNPYNSLNSDARGPSSGDLFDIDPEGNIYFIMTDGGQAGLHKLTKDGKIEDVMKGNFSVESFSFDSKFEILYWVKNSFSHPSEIYLWDKQITHFNDDFVKKYGLREAHPIKFKASDGVEVEGWVLEPYIRTREKKGKSPAILEIHGGPRTAYGYAFMFEFHLLAHNGFYVIFSNPRGSDGYGFDFAYRIVRNYGDRDYKDLMEFVDTVLEKVPQIDPDRLGVTGGSYGGFMTNWIVGHTDRFRRAVTQRSISNWISFYGTSDIGWLFGEYEVGEPPFDNPMLYWERSPIAYVKNVRTPLLILHAEQDYRCPIEQAEQLFVALRRLGKEVRFIRFPGESHELSRSGKPRHRIERLYFIRKWFEKM